MSQLKKGAILSYITIFLTNIVGLVLTPFIIKSLGDAEYGLYTLIGAFVGYISVLDFGLNNTIVRFVAKYRAEKDKKGEENFLAITMLIYAAISIVIAIIGIVLYFNLDTVFSTSLTTGELAKAKVMFMILIFNLAITLPGGAFTAICSGYEHFVFPRTINIVRYIVRSFMVVGLLLAGGDAIGLVLLDTIMNLLVIAFNGYYVLKKLNVTFKLYEFKTPLVKEIFSYSVWVFVFALVGQFQWKAGQIILGTLTNTTIVAIYTVGIMLGTYYGAFSTAISGVFLPRATKMTVEKATGIELTLVMVKIGRISLMVLLMILGGFILFGKQFILLWVGVNYIEAWFVALTIMIAYTIPLLQAFANLILEAKSLFRFKAIIYIVFISLGTLFGAFLISSKGIKGMVVGTATGWMISIVIMNFYYWKILKLEMLVFFKNVAARILPSFLVVLILGYFINMLPGSNWLNLGVKIIFFMIAYGLVIYFFGVNNSEKEMIRNIIPVLNNNNVKD
ncbi:oligosaccharide flippase family protein [uncultured Lutibacter sp.]|uniref:oligosaccharide flippase family protein n=1 Tax=uncultured Lutibacter sp. TaxID=437739 RepID=UPI002617CC03|nr:oligosaccharide flippase family protein [uncultured Lutibacter sp.]